MNPYLIPNLKINLRGIIGLRYKTKITKLRRNIVTLGQEKILKTLKVLRSERGSQKSKLLLFKRYHENWVARHRSVENIHNACKLSKRTLSRLKKPYKQIRKAQPNL